MLNWARRKNFVVMTIQESHMEDKDLTGWKDQWDGSIYYSSGSNNSRGVTTLIRKHLEHTVIKDYTDDQGR